MAVKRGGLGKGLDSLIPDKKVNKESTVEKKKEETGELIYGKFR